MPDRSIDSSAISTQLCYCCDSLLAVNYSKGHVNYSKGHAQLGYMLACQCTASLPCVYAMHADSSIFSSFYTFY